MRLDQVHMKTSMLGFYVTLFGTFLRALQCEKKKDGSILWEEDGSGSVREPISQSANETGGIMTSDCALTMGADILL